MPLFPGFFGSFHDLFLSPLGISHVGTSGRWFSIASISPDCGGHQTLGFLCSGEYLPPGSLAASLPLKSDRAPILKGSSSNHHFSRANMLNFWGGAQVVDFQHFFVMFNPGSLGMMIQIDLKAYVFQNG